MAKPDLLDLEGPNFEYFFNFIMWQKNMINNLRAKLKFGIFSKLFVINWKYWCQVPNKLNTKMGTRSFSNFLAHVWSTGSPRARTMDMRSLLWDLSAKLCSMIEL